MQISSSYSMSGVPYDIKHRNGNVPQFNAEQAVKESENTNRYMPEADFDEKAFAMIGPNAPQDVKDAWMEAAKEVNANGLGIKGNGMLSHISQMMVQRLNKQLKGEGGTEETRGKNGAGKACGERKRGCDGVPFPAACHDPAAGVVFL